MFKHNTLFRQRCQVIANPIWYQLFVTRNLYLDMVWCPHMVEVPWSCCIKHSPVYQTQPGPAGCCQSCLHSCCQTARCRQTARIAAGKLLVSLPSDYSLLLSDAVSFSGTTGVAAGASGVAAGVSAAAAFAAAAFAAAAASAAVGTCTAAI